LRPHSFVSLFLVVSVAPVTACRSTGSAARGPDAAREGAAETYTWPKLSLAAGGQLFADVRTEMRVDSDVAGDGTEVTLEDDFNVDDSVFAGRVDAYWRFTRRQALDLSFFKLDRNGTRTIDRDIQIGDVVFPVNTTVESDFETLVAKLAYRYSFFSHERWHAGASLGAYWLDLRSEWQATGGSLEEELDAKAPLPVLGVFGSYAFTPKLYLSGASEFFGLEYEQYDGFLNDTRLVLEHRTFEHLALGAGFDYFLINASVESEHEGLIHAELEYGYLGFLVFARLY
jgi:hypothetical protein